jgi:hypothetical protein
VVHGDAALGQQLLDIPVGQAITQISPDRDRDDLPREPEASEDRGRAMCGHRTILQPSAIDQRNSAQVRSRRACGRRSVHFDAPVKTEPTVTLEREYSS